MDEVKNLINLIVRAFYEQKEIIIVDILLSNPSVRDDHLATAMGMNIRDLQKSIGRLKSSGMIYSLRNTNKDCSLGTAEAR